MTGRSGDTHSKDSLQFLRCYSNDLPQFTTGSLVKRSEWTISLIYSSKHCPSMNFRHASRPMIGSMQLSIIPIIYAYECIRGRYLFTRMEKCQKRGREPAAPRYAA